MMMNLILLPIGLLVFLNSSVLSSDEKACAHDPKKANLVKLESQVPNAFPLLKDDKDEKRSLSQPSTPLFPSNLRAIKPHNLDFGTPSTGIFYNKSDFPLCKEKP